MRTNVDGAKGSHFDNVISSREVLVPTGAPKWRILYPDDIGTSDRIPGYFHIREKSRFSRGQGDVTVEEDADSSKETSANGVFAHTRNGFSLGAPNATAESWKVGPFSQKSEEHTARVVDYFREAGLPQDQMAETSINTWMSGGGPSTAIAPNGERVPAQVYEQKFLLGYVSRIGRTVAGLPVEDSFAWALLNANAEAVWESVWWPDLRASLAQDADALRERLLDAAWLERLPNRGEGGHLAIHHATPMGETWYSTVTYDIRDGNEIAHFNVYGEKVALVAWASGPGDDKK